MTTQEVQRKARFGHRDWVMYRDRAGIHHESVLTADTLKRAMLSTGTQRPMTLVCANDGTLMNMPWWMACNVLAQCQRGWR